jgi:bacterioferritin-associated ferredoxin
MTGTTLPDGMAPYDAEEEIVCVCHEVKRKTIRRLAEQLGDFDAIVAGTPMCQTCQGCESEIRRILAETRARGAAR